MCAFAGAAAGLGASAGLLHLPPFGKRRLVHRLESKTLPLTLIEGLGNRLQYHKKKCRATSFLGSFFGLLQLQNTTAFLKTNVTKKQN